MSAITNDKEWDDELKRLKINRSRYDGFLKDKELKKVKRNERESFS